MQYLFSAFICLLAYKVQVLSIPVTKNVVDELKLKSKDRTIIVSKVAGFVGAEATLNKIIPFSLQSDYSNELGLNIVDFNSALVGITNETIDGVYIDVLITYFQRNFFLDDSKALALFQQELLSLSPNPANSKVPVILIVVDDLVGTPVNNQANVVLTLLNEAWVLSGSEHSKKSLVDVFDIKILFKSQLSEPKTEKLTVNNVLSDVIGKTVRNTNTTAASVFDACLKSKHTSRIYNLPNKDVKGVDVCKSALEEAYDWARQAATASISKLNKPEVAGEFASYVNNLQAGAGAILFTAVNKSNINVEEKVFSLAKQDLSRKIFQMVSPFYRRFVTLARESALKYSNSLVEDLEISINILQDLNAIHDTVLDTFRKDTAKLLPAGAPADWTSEFECASLSRVLNDYIETRKEQSQMTGVLRRKRQPIALSIHALALHPFGRDHRQTPLTMLPGDDLVFDKDVAARQKALLVPVTRARSILLKAVSDQTPLHQKFRRSDAEFAREMLMFPLSVKDPSVPMMGGRAARRRSAQEGTDSGLSPERFIRWDVEPLAEAKENLDKIVQESEQNVSLKDQVLNIAPYFRQGFYRHPVISHQNAKGGEKYIPHKATPVVRAK